MAGQLRVDEITNEAGTGSPDFVNGIQVEGTTFTSADLEGSPDQGQAVVFTSPGTWTKPATVKRIKVTVVGAGGGATGIGGGGGGGAAIKWIPAPSMPGPVSVTVGAGSTGPGGTSSFGPFASATGGLDRSSGGVGSGGDLNITGGGGNSATTPTTSFARAGSSILGGGGQLSGNEYGGGGVRTGFTDAVGGVGVVVVEEFY
jgi:hypothetical protein